jgi:hypothetical protein
MHGATDWKWWPSWEVVAEMMVVVLHAEVLICLFSSPSYPLHIQHCPLILGMHKLVVDDLWVG